jgi:hypothetical protein
MSSQATTTSANANSLVTSTLSPYSKFKMALKSKEVQRQYPNLLVRFLDFCKFEVLDVEQKAIKFCSFAKSKSQEEVEDLIIRFVIFQMERIDKRKHVAAILRSDILKITHRIRESLVTLTLPL